MIVMIAHTNGATTRAVTANISTSIIPKLPTVYLQVDVLGRHGGAGPRGICYVDMVAARHIGGGLRCFVVEDDLPLHGEFFWGGCVVVGKREVKRVRSIRIQNIRKRSIGKLTKVDG